LSRARQNILQRAAGSKCSNGTGGPCLRHILFYSLDPPAARPFSPASRGPNRRCPHPLLFAVVDGRRKKERLLPSALQITSAKPLGAEFPAPCTDRAGESRINFDAVGPPSPIFTPPHVRTRSSVDGRRAHHLFFNPVGPERTPRKGAALLAFDTLPPETALNTRTRNPCPVTTTSNLFLPTRLDHCSIPQSLSPGLAGVVPWGLFFSVNSTHYFTTQTLLNYTCVEICGNINAPRKWGPGRKRRMMSTTSKPAYHQPKAMSTGPKNKKKNGISTVKRPRFFWPEKFGFFALALAGPKRSAEINVDCCPVTSFPSPSSTGKGEGPLPLMVTRHDGFFPLLAGNRWTPAGHSVEFDSVGPGLIALDFPPFPLEPTRARSNPGDEFPYQPVPPDNHWPNPISYPRRRRPRPFPMDGGLGCLFSPSPRKKNRPAPRTHQFPFFSGNPEMVGSLPSYSISSS